MVFKMLMKRPWLFAMRSGLILLLILILAHRGSGGETSQEMVARVCSQCHATVIHGQCVAGNCQAKPIIHSNERDWKLILDYMIDSLGCKMTRMEEKTITEFLERHYSGRTYPLTWTEVLTARAGSGWNIVTLTAWRDHLYAGTEGGGRVLRSVDGISWDEVVNTRHDKVYGITAYKGSLYAGTYNPQPQVWRSADGLDWNRVATLPMDQRGITSLGIFQGWLYAGTGGARIYRSVDGIQWNEAGILKKVKEPNWPYWVRFLKEFRGKLYAGLEGGGIYLTEDGTTWSEVKLPVTEKMKEKAGVRGVAIFKEHLYVGTTGTGEIWRSNDGFHWEEVLSRESGRGYSGAMIVFNDALYVSMNGEVLRSSDGLHWEPVGEISPKTVEAMEVFKGYLYAGTDRPPGAQIYRTTGLTPSLIRVPDQDIPVIGKFTGNYKDIQTGYHLYEVLEESLVDGASLLEHRWTISHPGGVYLLLAVRGYHSPNPNGDDFVFSYSTDDKNYTDMFTITRTEEGRSYQFYSLPSLPKGKIYIRVRNTERTKGHTALNKLYLDHLYLLVEGKKTDRSGI